MISKLSVPAAIFVVAGFVAGCSNIGDSLETTSALPSAPRVDPACQQLAASIDGLRREGVSEKVEKAAAKKYKMTAADLTKAAQLNRANDDFQSRCSTMPRSASTMKAASLKATAAPVTLSAAPTASAASASDAPIRTARAMGAPGSTFESDSAGGTVVSPAP